ncbi:hypothetical protein HZH66_010102 [Vespula vulgaris]|uniref:Protein kinase domain-containing protein n=1 Tax=Vespula vulgaris TaxID=7454 RepID=A0A834MXJ9_VESVU|nr:hypothetical protein HZH66_010102 [Vespula vulgaris]
MRSLNMRYHILVFQTILVNDNRTDQTAQTLNPNANRSDDFGVSVQEESEDKGPICPPLPAQYHPSAYNTTTQLHETIGNYTGVTEVQPVVPLLLNTPIEQLARPIPTVQEYPANNPPPIPPPPEKYYASTEICKSPLPPLPPSPTPSTPAAMSAKASSSLTSYSAEDTLTEEEDETAECILDFPREKLNIVENLGCGYFGDVHLCEVDRFPGYDDVFRNTDSDLVVVKSLKPGSSNALRIEFQQEAKRLARLNDRNVGRLLGASLENDPMCIVLENGAYGDLNQYLQSHIAETSTVHTAKTLSSLMDAKGFELWFRKVGGTFDSTQQLGIVSREYIPMASSPVIEQLASFNGQVVIVFARTHRFPYIDSIENH